MSADTTPAKAAVSAQETKRGRQTHKREVRLATQRWAFFQLYWGGKNPLMRRDSFIYSLSRHWHRRCYYYYQHCFLDTEKKAILVGNYYFVCMIIL